MMTFDEFIERREQELAYRWMDYVDGLPSKRKPNFDAFCIDAYQDYVDACREVYQDFDNKQQQLENNGVILLDDLVVFDLAWEGDELPF